jgi:hypothetical protein
MLIDKQEFVELIKKMGMPTILPRIIACANYSINSDKSLKQTCTSYYVMLKRAEGAVRDILRLGSESGCLCGSGRYWDYLLFLYRLIPRP